VSLTAFADYIRSTLSASDPALVPAPKLQDIGNSLDAVTGRVETFASQADPAQLTAAWSRVNPVLSSLSGLPAIKTPSPDYSWK
jgi:hypothetical protein